MSVEKIITRARKAAAPKMRPQRAVPRPQRHAPNERRNSSRRAVMRGVKWHAW